MKTFQDANHDAPNVTYFYDPLGRLARVEQLLDPEAPVGEQLAVTSYSYDLHGNLTSVTDANGNVTTYVVDDLGRTRRITSPVTGVTEVSYDEAGALHERTDARDVTLTNTYDAAGRLTGQEYAGGVPSEELVYEYDAAGRRTRAEVDGGVVQTFTHDRRGLVLSSTLEVDGQTHTTSYQYDADGALEQVTYPSERVVTFTPDFAGRPTAITATPMGGSAVTVLADATYLPSGPPVTLDLGTIDGRVTETLGHDWQYRRTAQAVTAPGPTTYVNLGYGYDDAGNLETVTDSIANRTATYVYDDLSRLVSATFVDGTRSFDYDAIGNITSQTADGGTVTYGYEPNTGSENSPLLETVTAPTWSSTLATDDAGNITSEVATGGTTTYTPDLRNHLGGRSFGGETLENVFTADGRLARSEHVASGGEVLYQVLDPAGRRLALWSSTAGWRDYLYLGDRLLGYFDAADTAAKLVFTDHIGMPMLVVDGTGADVWTARAEPYGQLRGTVGKTFDPGLRYPGQWQDWLELEAQCIDDSCTPPEPLQQNFSLFENGFRFSERT